MDHGTLETLFVHTPMILAQEGPVVDGVFLIKLISRILHILSAIILVGGLFYLKTILAPGGTGDYFAGRRQVWARWVGMTSLFLVVTGLYNFIVLNRAAREIGEALPPTYHAMFGIKFLLGLGVMFLAAILAGKTGLAEKFRKDMHRWLNVAWFASLAVIVLAAIMRSYHY